MHLVTTLKASCEFVTEDRGARGKYTLTAEAIAERKYDVHMYRVVGVMSVFSLGSISAFVGDST
jgi:hypothetical protein